jgi:hypothetical protein
VGGPIVHTWIEQPHQLPSFDVNRADITAFMAITSKARPGEVFFSSFTAVFSGDDMVCFVGQICIFFME